MVSSLVKGSFVSRLSALLLLAGVFVISAALAGYFSLRGRTVKVPQVVTLKELAAQDRIESNGLIMQVRGRTPNDTVPAGAVCDQFPSAGTVVKTGQYVRVMISLGAPSPLPGQN